VSQEINFLADGATQPKICQSMRDEALDEHITDFLRVVKKMSENLLL
jgi:hypothetical protein